MLATIVQNVIPLKAHEFMHTCVYTWDHLKRRVLAVMQKDLAIIGTN